MRFVDYLGGGVLGDDELGESAERSAGGFDGDDEVEELGGRKICERKTRRRIISMRLRKRSVLRNGKRLTSEDVNKERRDVLPRGERDVGLSLSDDGDLVVDDGDKVLDPIREGSVEDEERGKADLLELGLKRRLEVERRGRGKVDRVVSKLSAEGEMNSSQLQIAFLDERDVF